MSFVALNLHLKLQNELALEEEVIGSNSSCQCLFKAYELETEEFISVAIEPASMASNRKKVQTCQLRLVLHQKMGDNKVTSIINKLLGEEPGKPKGARNWVIEHIDLAKFDRVEIWNWPDLLSGPYGNHLYFSFATPVIIQDLAIEAISPQSSCFPYPTILFGSLANRWHQLGGPPLPDSFGSMLSSSEHCRVADYRLVTKRVTLKETCYNGFQGWVEYQCRGLNSENAMALAALSRLARLTGTGNFTTCGLGVTRVKIIE